MARTNVYRDRALHVMSAKCDTCIFRPGNKMSLQPGRVESMVAECIRDQGVIPCHKTIHGENDGKNAVCRGFWDTQRRHVGLLSAAARMNIVRFVGLTTVMQCTHTVMQDDGRQCKNRVRVPNGTKEPRCSRHA